MRDHETERPDGRSGVRLNKYLAEHGIASRRRADELIAAGEVLVDGEIVTELGTRVDPRAQRVEIDGVVLKPESVRKRYYLLNKPAGVLCTNDERESRRRAIDLVTDRKKGRIYTVGRLDEETVGLVLLTNDGEFAQCVTHPRYGMPKTYVVKLRGRCDEHSIQKIRNGVWLAEGRTTGARVVVQRRTERQTTLLVTLHEGKNREVRRVFARVGAKVHSLRRVRIGNLTDRGLRVGQWRPLTRQEVRELLEIAERPGEAERATRSYDRERRRGTRRPGARRGAR